MLEQIDTQEKFQEALAKLYRDEYSLIRRRCSERSIVFRLGLYLANSLTKYGLDIDCEYNKNGDKPKALKKKRLNYPDILVHKRESNESNLLIAEVKTPNDTQSGHFQNDTTKLIGFTQEAPYLYKWGVHAYISATYCSLVWYTTGEIHEYVKYKVDRNTHALLCVDQNNPRNQTAFDQWYVNNYGDIFKAIYKR